MGAAAHCIFEYLYRDADNYKTWGELLLTGLVSDADVERVRQKLAGGEFFIAEQIGVPTLFQQLWDECGSEYSEASDHVWHEFRGFRPATPEDVANLPLWGSAEALVKAITETGQWNEALSDNWRLAQPECR